MKHKYKLNWLVLSNAFCEGFAWAVGFCVCLFTAIGIGTVLAIVGQLLWVNGWL